YDAKKEYINAKSNANKCLQLQSNYSHEILETINYHDLYIVKANCYLYENKLDSMLMELKKNNSDALSTLLSDKTQIDTVQQDSMINFVTGMVRIPLKGENIAILNSVTFHEMEGYVTLSYLDYSNNEVVIFSNPIPQVGTMYELNYKKLDEYIDFQTALYQELDNQIDTYKE
ncbi:MAG: hypothetical protein KAR38_04695, partial [Calditrichia bacterium]|nr:hypothetical protein [Calditrichia bacterium]